MSSFPGNPFNQQSFKTLIILPGETKVIKKNMQIFKTINEGNVNVSSTCLDIEERLNLTTESLVRYAFLIEVMDELISRGSEDLITGLGLGNDFYRFASPVSLAPFRVDDSSASSGTVILYNAMVDALPNGSMLFKSPTYKYENWAGPSGDSSRDNVYRGSVEFSSFPSIVEDLKMYLSYENYPTFGNYTQRYQMRIYPIRIG